MIVNKRTTRQSLQNTCLVALSLVAILLVDCGGGFGIPRGAELALLDKVGSDFLFFSDTEHHGDDAYCVHNTKPIGWAKTYAVRQDGVRSVLFALWWLLMIVMFVSIFSN